MARNERRALGRGLGSLIPDRDQNVSRETISDEGGSERPTDIFFSGPSGADSKERRSSSIAADLMKPMPRGHRETKKKQAAKARGKSAGAKSAEVSHDVEQKQDASPAERKGARSGKSTGKGKSASSKRELFADIIDQQDPETEEVELVPVPGAVFAEIDVNLVVPNPKQPREVFDEYELEELASSIREIGVLQPIVVRPVDGSEDEFSEIVEQRRAEGINELPEFELIMGERRLRATKLAGFDVIPAIVRDTDDDDLLRDALLENLHRTQLNPIEEANAYQQLMSDFGYTQQELSDRIARSRPQIANSLRLLKLPPTVQRKLAAGVISSGHARALLGLPNAMQMETLAERIISEGLSVRTTEEIVALGDVTEKVASKKSAKRMPQPPSERASVVIDRLTDLLDTRVTVQEGKKKGRITIEYAGAEDLDRISQVISTLKGPAF